MATLELAWDPFNAFDPGPCIDVQIVNSLQVTGLAVESEWGNLPFIPQRMKALLDTGASLCNVSRTYAKHAHLFQTGDRTSVSAVGATYLCEEYAARIIFPDTPLRPIDPVRMVAIEFPKEKNYAVLIGREILRNWIVTFDGGAKKVTIIEKD